jgi:hypothetical protein
MPISDNYVVQYLVQNTGSGEESLLWREAESEGYVTFINDIKVEFECAPSRTGSRFYLTFSAAVGSVQIVEPHNVGFLRPRYANDDQEHLARLMKDLSQAIRRQCHMRRKAEADSAGTIRESVFRRLLGVRVPDL